MPTYHRRASEVASCVLLALTVASCGKSDPPRHALSGLITYRGHPVPTGTVRFEPIGSVVNHSTIGEAEIQNGKYSTLPGKGIIGGTQKVFVSGYHGIPEPGSGPMGASVFEMVTLEIDLLPTVLPKTSIWQLNQPPGNASNRMTPRNVSMTLRQLPYEFSEALSL